MKYKEKLTTLAGLEWARDSFPKIIYSLSAEVGYANSRIALEAQKQLKRDLSLAVKAYKKQISQHIKFPNLDEKGNIVMKYHCPVCNFNEIEMNQKFCQNCGQALGWGEDVAEEVEDEENG